MLARCSVYRSYLLDRGAKLLSKMGNSCAVRKNLQDVSVVYTYSYIGVLHWGETNTASALTYANCCVVTCQVVRLYSFPITRLSLAANQTAKALIMLTLYRMVMPIGTPFLKEKINN